MILSIKVNQLPVVSAIQLTDHVVVEYNGGTARMLVSELAAQLGGGFVYDQIKLRDTVTDEVFTFVVEDGQLTKL